ncbi:MAG: LytTR family DNA-binding domain-containing protein [Bacilli bacterium]|jgi:DNA-binding LytR/AlgR family response regulator|nr:LytTR family DNA-binding domain-containing protein [Bacilli bacterium]MCH4211086.1 LytTR family DNA-binding domain-containing protein [Bacilli bacterium]MCH4228631.1 LytTR family DNA-binding domain-containing protein [Bacilli bacterium]MCI2054861.1 LytTR family DNA-binding domain-containing protein [Bacilli bacterium]
MKLVFVDNEESQLKTLVGFVTQFEKDNSLKLNVVCFSNAFDLIEKYDGDYDAIFMDINMPLLDGMTAAKKIRLIDEKVNIVFITNLAQYAIDGYKVNALDYVLKPLSYFEFSVELKKILAKNAQKSSFILIKSKDVLKKIASEDIYYCDIFKHEVCVHSKEGDYTFRGALKDIEEKVDPKLFSRANSGALVNLSCVSEIVANFAMLTNGGKVEISRLRKKEFLDALTSYINS